MTIPQLHAVVDGDLSAQPVIVLGPSLGTTTASWQAAADLLRTQYAVVRFDLPGHGDSSVADAPFSLAELADAVVALADSLGVNRFDYAGVSVCGGLALELAHRHPSRVKHVASVCSSAKFGTPETWRERAEHIRAEGTVVQLDGLAERWFAPDTIRENLALVQQLTEMVANTSDEGYAQVCDAIGTYDATGYLSSITVPVLVISGELDAGTPPAAGKQIADAVPNAEQIVIANASHQAAAERPGEVADALLAFFAR